MLQDSERFCKILQDSATYKEVFRPCGKRVETDFLKNGQNEKLTTKKKFTILRYHHETCTKRSPQWLVILIKIGDDSSKMVDCLILVKFLDSPVFYESVSSPFDMQVFGLYINGQKQYFENNEEIFVINAIALQHCATES